MKKPYAPDWVLLRRDLEHSIHLNLYWYEGRIYDELSAKHRGIIGEGYTLKEYIRKTK